MYDKRSIVRPDFTLLVPEGLVETKVPGYKESTIKILAAPPTSSTFVEYLVEMKSGGESSIVPEKSVQHAMFVLSGEGTLLKENEKFDMAKDSFAYLPPGAAFGTKSRSSIFRYLIVKKRYVPLGNASPPPPIITTLGNTPYARKGADSAKKQLIPIDNQVYDMSIDVLSFGKGATVSRIETHVEEHGMYFLEGEGIYLLGDVWNQVRPDDFIWLRSFTPQWFVCHIPASYLLYTPRNRDLPLP